MIDVILVCHGDLAKVLVETAQLILGEQDHVYTLGLHLGDDIDNLRIELVSTIENARNISEVLILTDLFSGSPFNVTSSLMEKYSFYHITGVNLPILLEVFTSRDYKKCKDICEDIILTGKESIINVNNFFEEKM